ncbi:MAG TPA: hypothetical protein VGS27_17635 [Candidatus Sulfotelmatobacter sp.]|nr:hypothetical protein [Candidatus Sulfotelmatobacter sp.]
MTRSLGLFWFLVCSVAATAQYGINWPKQPSTFTSVQPGSQKVRIGGVNDFLYTYDVNVIEISEAIPQPQMAPQGALAGCQTATGQPQADLGTFSDEADKAFAAYNSLFPKAAIPPKTLEQTSADWRDNVQPHYDKLADDSKAAQKVLDAITDPGLKTACQAVMDSATSEYKKLQDADTKLNHSPHVVEATFTAKNCKSEILTVTEKYNGTPTGQSLTAQFDVECDQVTVGGGILLTEIQSRTYTSSTSPTQSGQFLVVGGTGRFRPTFLVGLTSFNFPFEPLGHKLSSALGDMRLGISTGPVLQNSKSDVSAFGWFVGPTVSFMRRLYLSPGLHVGEFADFPLGFTKQGDPIPSNFGSLTPNKRWTGRFSIGITVKGWDLTKTLKGSQDTPAVQPAKKPQS